jgi:hypothetical protein
MSKPSNTAGTTGTDRRSGAPSGVAGWIAKRGSQWDVSGR